MVRFAQLCRQLAPLLLLIAVGCRGPLAKIPGNPLARDTEADRVRYGRTPAEKVEELRELAEQAESLSPTEQQEIASVLATQAGQEEVTRLRMELIRTLGHFETTESLSAQLSALSDPDPNVRVAACEALGVHPHMNAIEPLSRALDTDSDIDVRQAAARSLGRFRAPEAVAALGETLEERNPALRTLGMSSLRTASGVDLGYDVVAWQNHVQTVIASLDQQRQGLASLPPTDASGSRAPPPTGALPPTDGGSSSNGSSWPALPAGYTQ